MESWIKRKRLGRVLFGNVLSVSGICFLWCSQRGDTLEGWARQCGRECSLEQIAVSNLLDDFYVKSLRGQAAE